MSGPRRTTALLCATLGLLLAGPASADAATKATDCRAADEPVTNANLATAERSLHCLVNVYRAANGQGLLTEAPQLGQAARGHSEHMEAKKEFGHQPPDVSDGTPNSRARAAGFECGGFDCVGENVAYSNFPGYSPSDMFEGWRNSPGHNANMLYPDYVTAGMGFALGPNWGLTGTQKFATVSNGATSTAADMLTNQACTAADAAVAAGEKRVSKAKAKLAKASKKKKAKARAKLRKAKQALKTARAQQAKDCDLSY